MRWPIALVLLAGCVEFGINPIEPDGQVDRRVAVLETFVQSALPKIDVLLVVDQTASMAQEHAALSGNLILMLDQLEEEDVAWQLGVVGTSVGGQESGWLQGSPWVLTPTTPNLQVQVDSLFQVKDRGVLEESGLAAAILALELAHPGEANAGFRRHDAALHVILVSDADDASGGDPVTELVNKLQEEAENGLPAVASAVVGDVPSGCVSLLGAAQPGHRYGEAAELTGGRVVSICSSDFGSILGDLGHAAVIYQDRFSLREQPIEGSLQVFVDGVETTAWTLASDPPEFMFEKPPVGGAQVAATYHVMVRG